MNRKTILLALLLVACSLNVLADEPLIKLHIAFRDGTVTKEVEHYLTPSQITHSADGKSITLHVKYGYDTEDHTVTYNLADIEKITHLPADPSINLTANADPQNKSNYYTTFFSGLESYTLPAGVTAYTAVKNGSYARLVTLATAGESLPKDCAVLLKSTSGNIAMTVDSDERTNEDPNLLKGVDVKTPQSTNDYHVFTYGNKGLGFYLIKTDADLAANKAFISKEDAQDVRVFTLMFPEDNPTGIEETLAGDEMVTGGDIYSVSGVRYNQPQKGLNIINGKKVFIK